LYALIVSLYTSIPQSICPSLLAISVARSGLLQIAASSVFRRLAGVEGTANSQDRGSAEQLRSQQSACLSAFTLFVNTTPIYHRHPSPIILAEGDKQSEIVTIIITDSCGEGPTFHSLLVLSFTFTTHSYATAIELVSINV